MDSRQRPMLCSSFRAATITETNGRAAAAVGYAGEPCDQRGEQDAGGIQDAESKKDCFEHGDLRFVANGE